MENRISQGVENPGSLISVPLALRVCTSCPDLSPERGLPISNTMQVYQSSQMLAADSILGFTLQSSMLTNAPWQRWRGIAGPLDWLAHGSSDPNSHCARARARTTTSKARKGETHTEFQCRPHVVDTDTIAHAVSDISILRMGDLP